MEIWLPRFYLPWTVPALAAAAALCAALALALRASVSVFSLVGPRPPLREQVNRAVAGLLARHPGLARLFGPSDVEERLSLAGNPLGITPEEFHAARIAAAGLSAAGLAAGAASGSLFPALLALAFKLPDWWLSYLITERRKKMRREFMVVASRLATALAAGLPVNQALEWAARGADARRAALREELARCTARVNAGADFAAAFDEFASRTGLLEARRLATVVIQAQRFGGSVADKLAEAVRDARERRKAEIIGQAQSAEKKMQLAVFVMALPTVLLTLAPMGITLLRQGLF